MPDPTTPNIGLAVPVIGSDVGTWGTPLNNNFSTTDTLFGAVTTIGGLTNAPVSMTTNQSLASVVRFSGVLTGTVVITLGAVIKSWIFENLTTGNFAVVVRGNPGTGNIIGLPPGSCQGYWDGTNMSFLNLGKVGEYWDYAGSAVPLWVSASTIPPYLNCNGGTFNAVTYPLLNQILGGNTLPDSLGKFRATLNQGSDNLTSTFGLDGDINLSTGGSQSHTLTIAEMPSHNHAATDAGHTHLITDPGHVHAFAGSMTSPGGFNAVGGANSGGAASTSLATTGISVNNGNANITVDPQGGNGAHSIVPPAYIGGISMIRAA